MNCQLMKESFKGDRLVIPKALRPDILKQLHAAHLRAEKRKQRARMLVYWPGLNADIEGYVRSCQICSRNMTSNQKEPMINHAILALPWLKVTSDLFTLNSNDYLMTVDYYSHL